MPAGVDRQSIADRYATQLGAMTRAPARLAEKALAQVEVEPEELRALVEKRDILDAWIEDAGIGFPSGAGCFPGGASPYGCEEMSGNVWEWTRSRDQSYPYDPGDGREEPPSHRTQWMVLRGAAYYSDSSWPRCASRGRVGPDLRFNDLGFRVVVSPFLPLDSDPSEL